MPFYQARSIETSETGLLQSNLLSIRPVLLYVLLANRNAWHGTTSRIYQGAEGLFGSVEAAQDESENTRQRGTWFQIMQVPGLALRSSGGLVVIAEHHSRTPFAGWDHDTGAPHLTIGSPLGRSLCALNASGTWRRRISKDSFIQGEIGDLFVDELPHETLVGWSSRSVGARYYLQWDQNALDYSRDGVDAICGSFREVNGAAAVLEAERQYFATRDATFTNRLKRPFRFPRPPWYSEPAAS